LIEIVWSQVALSRVQQIRAFVAQDRPVAAERLATRIVAAVEVLRVFPHMGRAGMVPGTRELVIGRTPYVVVYRVQTKIVTILTIWHGAQQRTP
jgi:plasmid stabilization system protein ParE